jgi:hypothetical protein
MASIVSAKDRGKIKGKQNTFACSVPTFAFGGGQCNFDDGESSKYSVAREWKHLQRGFFVFLGGLSFLRQFFD